MNYLGTKELETNRLILRKFKIDDYKDMFFNYCNDHEVTKYLTWDPHPSILATKDFLNKVALVYGNSTFRWAICLKEDNRVIGSIDVTKIINDRAEIGYCLSKKYWNQGIMSEALKAVRDYLINEVQFDKLIIRYNLSNIGSKKVALKCDFKETDIIKEVVKNNEIDICVTEYQK